MLVYIPDGIDFSYHIGIFYIYILSQRELEKGYYATHVFLDVILVHQQICTTLFLYAYLIMLSWTLRSM